MTQSSLGTVKNRYRLRKTGNMRIQLAGRRRTQWVCSRSIIVIALVTLVSVNSVQAQEPTATGSEVEKSTESGGSGATAPAAPRVVDYNNPTLEDILAAWREREEKVKNYELVWDERCENHRPLALEPDAVVPDPSKIPIITISTGNRFVATHHSMHLKWHPAANSPRPNNAAPSFSITRMNRDGFGAFANSARLNGTFGRIKRPEFVADDLSMILMMPILALYRPIWRTCRSLQPISLFEQNGITIQLLDFRDPDNRPLLEIEKRPRRYRFALKCVPGFPPKRIECYHDVRPDRPSTPSTIDLELAEHPIAGWVPQRWESRSILDADSGPTLNTTNVCTLTSARFNFELSPRDFDPTYFPKGTIVSDVRNPDGGEVFFRSDGQNLVPIDVYAEQKAQDVETKRETLRNRDPWGFAEYSIVVNVALFLCLFGVWYWRRWSRH